jgi:hypothetical protein
LIKEVTQAAATCVQISLGKKMKRNALLMWIILISMAPGLNWAAEIPARDLKLSFGMALGLGFVESSDGELLSLQIRTDCRWNWAYLALRTSYVAQLCNGSPNPAEISILVGVSLPFDSGCYRISAGVGFGETTLHGAKRGLPCELRFKKGIFGLTAFANFNRAHNFFGVCAGFDVSS